MEKPCILVIDDDEQMLKMLNIALRRAGMDVITAADGPSALRLFEERRPDLALVDIAMPGMDGYDVIRQMHEMDHGGRRAAIIILTAHSHATIRSSALDLGVDLFLTKPVTPSQLVEHIRTLLEERSG